MAMPTPTASAVAMDGRVCADQQQKSEETRYEREDTELAMIVSISVSVVLHHVLEARCGLS